MYGDCLHLIDEKISQLRRHSLSYVLQRGFVPGISILEMPNESEAQIRCRGTAACFIGNVTKVIDGDTLDVNGIGIRLSFINTPKLGMTNFTEAKELALQICPIGSLGLVDQDDEQKKVLMEG